MSGGAALEMNCTFVLAVVLKLRLLQVGMALHLIDCWHCLGCLQEVLCLSDAEVGDTNSTSESLCHQLLHGLDISYNHIVNVHISTCT